MKTRAFFSAGLVVVCTLLATPLAVAQDTAVITF
jgi:hypothetical protein